jgi:EamA domain-containing membrane protein RarD
MNEMYIAIGILLILIAYVLFTVGRHKLGFTALLALPALNSAMFDTGNLPRTVLACAVLYGLFFLARNLIKVLEGKAAKVVK